MCVGRSLLDEILHHGDQAVLGERLQQEAIGSCFVRAPARREDGEDEHERVSSLGVCFHLPAQGEPVQLRDEDLAHHEIRLVRPDFRERLLTIQREIDAMARFGEELRAECANVRVTLHEQYVKRLQSRRVSAISRDCAISF